MKAMWRACLILVMILLGCAWLPVCGLVWGDTYTIQGPDIMAEWTFPKGTVDLGGDGSIQPVLIRKNINMCVNATEFAGGVKAAGSNKKEASHAIDGDPATSWRPLATDGLEDWWLEINLGRVVRATKVRLVFSQNGQPFEFFRVYISSGSSVTTGGTALLPTTPRQYRLLWSVTARNVEPVWEYDLPGDGELVQYVYVSAMERKTENAGLAELEVYALAQVYDLGYKLFTNNQLYK